MRRIPSEPSSRDFLSRHARNGRDAGACRLAVICNRARPQKAMPRELRAVMFSVSRRQPERAAIADTHQRSWIFPFSVNVRKGVPLIFSPIVKYPTTTRIGWKINRHTPVGAGFGSAVNVKIACGLLRWLIPARHAQVGKCGRSRRGSKHHRSQCWKGASSAGASDSEVNSSVC